MTNSRYFVVYFYRVLVTLGTDESGDVLAPGMYLNLELAPGSDLNLDQSRFLVIKSFYRSNGLVYSHNYFLSLFSKIYTII